MTDRLRSFLLVLAVVLVGAGGVADAAPPARSATDSVRRANQTIARLLRAPAKPDSAEEQKLAGRIRTSVRDFLDVDELGERAMGRHWKDLDDAQRVEFLGVLRELIERNYIRGLRANLDYEVAYLGEEGSGDERLVRTEIRVRSGKRDRTLAIDYRVRRTEGSWRAYDVVTDGVGLVENYRAQFNRIIGKEGFKGLLARMKAKAEELEKEQ